MLASAAMFTAFSDTDTQSISWSEQIMQLVQSKLVTYTVSGIDSAETETPTFPAGYFDATLFNDPLDSVTVSIDLSSAAGTDSISKVILLGAFDGNNLGNAIDTFPTNGLTLIQRQVVVTEANKYIYPFWGVKVIGFDGTVATCMLYFQNYPKKTKVYIDTI